jgi:acyl-CoA hydrolase
MTGRAPRRLTSIEDCVEQALAKVGRRVTLCTPIGAGKPVALVNAFYRRAAADPRIELAILTGLTLARPRPASELERRLVEPIAAKIYGDAPEPAWVEALRASRLPPNVRVQEFFMEPGAWLHSPLAQQWYASINYTHVARSVLAAGANVVAQQVAARPGGRLSLGSNPDVTVDLLPALRERERGGAPVACIGQVNDRMPFMTRAAITSSSPRRTCRSRRPITRSRSPRACWSATAARSRSASASSATRSCTR